MKKKIRRLRLDRETVRNLTPESLDNVAGAGWTDDTCWNSCDTAVTRPASICNSCIQYPTVCC